MKWSQLGGESKRLSLKPALNQLKELADERNSSVAAIAANIVSRCRWVASYSKGYKKNDINQIKNKQNWKLKSTLYFHFQVFSSMLSFSTMHYLLYSAAAIINKQMFFLVPITKFILDITPETFVW